MLVPVSQTAELSLKLLLVLVRNTLRMGNVKMKIMVTVLHILHLTKMDYNYPNHLQVNSERTDSTITKNKAFYKSTYYWGCGALDEIFDLRKIM